VLCVCCVCIRMYVCMYAYMYICMFTWAIVSSGRNVHRVEENTNDQEFVHMCVG